MSKTQAEAIEFSVRDFVAQKLTAYGLTQELAFTDLREALLGEPPTGDIDDTH